MGWNTETERQDDGRWIAEIAAVPGVIVYGKTEDEARRKACAPVTVAPVTSTIRGVPSEVVLNEKDGMKSQCAVNLHNAVTVSQQRLGKRVAQLSPGRMSEVCAALRFSLGCDSD